MHFTDEIDWNLSESTTIAPMPEVPSDDVTEERAPVMPVSTFAAPVMNDTARTVAESESSVLASHGIGDSEQLFATGTALADVGHESLGLYAAEYNAFPSPQTAIGDFQEQIRAEERRDIVADLVGFRLDIDGKLAPTNRLAGGAGNTVEHVAWRQLIQAVETPNVNAGLAKRTRCQRRMRCRKDGDGRSVFAIVSSDPVRGYQVFDGGEVAELVMRGLHDAGMAKEAKCDLEYDPESTRYRIRTILQAPVDIMAHRGVGRVHQVFFDVKGGDNGETSISGAMGVMRIRCLNASLSQADAMRWSRRHVGNMSDIRHMVARAASKWTAVASEMRDLWARASAEWYLDAQGGRLSVPEAIERLVGNGLIPRGGLSAEDAIDAYTQAWQAEEGVHSAAGVVMALQRAAHETTWSTKWATDEIEEAASGLLYQKNYVLDEVRA
jgi:hypothetical protein